MKGKKYVDNDIKRAEVMKWLESTPRELYPKVAEEMWPDMDKDAALSLFMKKFYGARRDS